MIKFENVDKCYSNGYIALDNVSFNLAAGEFAFLTGHSGAGKSTLLRLIAGIEFASKGNIFVGKHHLNRMPSRHIPFLRRQIGIILQTPELMMNRPVADNVSLPLVITGHSYYEIKHRVRAALAKVGLHNKERYYPFELSTGEQQRVAIARAIISKPALLLADEPTGNLDPNLAAEMIHLFEEFNRLGTTILIASHDLALINQLKHRMLTLVEGKLKCDA